MPIPFLIFMICAGIGAYGLTEAMAFVGRNRPNEPIRSIRNWVEASAVVWEPSTPLTLRRKFVATQAITYAGALIFAYGLWFDERYPADTRHLICFAGLAMALFQLIRLAAKALQYGL